MIQKKIKFVFTYALTAALYYAFDLIYMPWLGLRFGFAIFIPLYPSILLANLLGVYLHDLLKEDVFFLELGRNWIDGRGSPFEFLKTKIRKSKRITFIMLSIWPSPIASYLFFREKKAKRLAEIVRTIAIGSIFCTFVWGGGISLVIYAIKKIILSLNV